MSFNKLTKDQQAELLAGSLVVNKRDLPSGQVMPDGRYLTYCGKTFKRVDGDEFKRAR